MIRKFIRKKRYKLFKEKEDISVIKDFIINEMYYLVYENGESQTIHVYLLNNEQFGYSIESKKFEYWVYNDAFIERLIKIIKKERILDHKPSYAAVKKAFDFLLKERYLYRNKENRERIKLTEKGKKYQLNDKSFESDYKTNKKTDIRIQIAVFAILLSTLTTIFNVFFK